MPSMFDIIKHCNCQKKVDYVKIKTGSNDPQISKKMRFSQYVNTNSAKTVYNSDVQSQLLARGIIPR